MEHKIFQTFEYKILDDDQGIVEHFVAVTGNRDLGNDRIISGAFKKTLVERGNKVKVLDAHRTDSIQAVIGKNVRMQEVGRDQLPPDVLAKYPEATGGLKVTTQYLMDTPEGRGAFLRIKSGAVDEYSIGYDTIKGAVEHVKSADGNVERHLKEIKLYEYGPVIFAMNPAAATLSAKDADILPSESKPYRNVPDDLQDKMESCVQQVMDKGSDKETAIAICYTSVVEGKSLSEAFTLHGISEGGDPPSQRKYGRTISAATLAKLKAARDVIDELCEMGVIPDDDEEELTAENKSAKIFVTPDETQAVTEQLNTDAAGPVRPPTDGLLRLIDLYLSELHH